MLKIFKNITNTAKDMYKEKDFVYLVTESGLRVRNTSQKI